MSRKKERRKREREKMPFIVATYVYASSQGQRTHFARTNCENMVRMVKHWLTLQAVADKQTNKHNCMVLEKTLGGESERE